MESLTERFKRLKRHRLFPRLVFVELDITDRCNLACYFCNQAGVRRRSGRAELSLDKVLSLLDEMRDLGLTEIRLSGGGEPTFHPEFRSIVEHIRKLDIAIVNLTTNGLLLDADLTDLLLKCRWLTVQFSLGCFRAGDWKRMSGGSENDFQRIIDNINYLVQKRKALNLTTPSILLSFGVDEMTYDKLEEGYEFACNMGVDDILFHSYTKVEHPDKVVAASDSIVDSLKSIIEENNRTHRLRNVIFSLASLNLNEDIIEEIQQADKDTFSCLSDSSAPCFMPWYGTKIRANGEVLACCAAAHLLPSIGNVNDSSVASIWYGDGYRALRDNFERLFNPDVVSRTHVDIPPLCRPDATLDLACPIKMRLEILEHIYGH